MRGQVVSRSPCGQDETAFESVFEACYIFQCIPETLQASIMGYLTTIEMGRVECSNSAFYATLQSLSGLCVTELAAYRMVHDALLLPRLHPNMLPPGESWKGVWSVAALVLDACRSETLKGGHDHRRGLAQALALEDGVQHLSATQLQGVRAAVASLSRSHGPMPLWVARISKLALALGKAGYWAIGTELLHTVAAPAGAADHCTNLEQTLLRAQMLASASTFLIDKCYAATYVSTSVEACRDLELAVLFSKDAVRLARSVASATTAVEGVGRPALRRDVAVSLRSALYAQGRAFALCGQQIALGAMLRDEEREARLPSVSDLFSAGQEALAECLATAEGPDAAKIRAAIAELWYCAASSSFKGVGVFVPASQAHKRFEALAGLEHAPRPIFNILTGASRLTHASLTHMGRALAELEDLGEGETVLAASVLKDLGKVHIFAKALTAHPGLFELAGLPIRQDHHAEATSKLTRALQLYCRLQGEQHKNTENVRRMLACYSLLNDGNRAFARVSSWVSDAVLLEGEEREASLYLSRVDAANRSARQCSTG